jgi:predicted RNA binding protein YcfA (HicA-like mRNA interferase family)
VPKLAPTHWQVQEGIFLAEGFRFVRQVGSHRAYVKPGVPRPVVIPAYPAVPVSIIRNNMRTAGMTRERYFEVLERVR